MCKVYGALLVAVLWGAVVAPVLRPQESFQAEPVAAQPVGLAAYISAACLVDPVCVAAGAVTVAAFVGLVVTVACYSGADCSLESLKSLADVAIDWFTDTSEWHPGVEQFKRQYQAHPLYYYLTGEMLSEMAEWFAAYTDVGWQTETFAGYQCAILRTTEVGDATPPQITYGRLYSETPNWSPPAATWQGPGEFQLRLALAPTWGTSYTYDVLWEVWEGELDTGTLRLSETYNGLKVTPYSGGTVLLGDDFYEADLGKVYSGRVSVRESTGTAGYITVGGFHDMAIMFMDDEAHWQYSYLHPVDMMAEGRWEYPAAGTLVNTVLSPDVVVDWDGVSDLPLADGTTGAVVVTAEEWATPDEKSWWEGLFGGLTDPLGRIWDVVKDIPGALTDILEGIQAIPQTLVDAIATAVVPTESVSERTGDLGDTMVAKAPFAWPVVVFAVVSDLFEGGTDCPTINMGTESVGWPAVEMEMCVPSGAQTILYTLTDVVAAAMVMVWAYWVYRRMLGS